MTTRQKPLEYFLELQYPFNVAVEPDGGYVIEFPDLPGCITQAETLKEISAMAEDARTGWIETEYERDATIPLPSQPIEYSGKFNVRLPKSLHRALSESASRESVSLNQYVVMLLSRGDAESRMEQTTKLKDAQVKTVEA